MAEETKTVAELVAEVKTAFDAKHDASQAESLKGPSEAEKG
jgi:hypothetical protein